MEPREYPKDFRVFLRYHNALRRLPIRSRPVEPLTLEDLDAFARVASLPAVRWE